MPEIKFQSNLGDLEKLLVRIQERAKNVNFREGINDTERMRESLRKIFDSNEFKTQMGTLGEEFVTLMDKITIESMGAGDTLYEAFENMNLGQVELAQQRLRELNTLIIAIRDNMQASNKQSTEEYKALGQMFTHVNAALSAIKTNSTVGGFNDMSEATQRSTTHLERFTNAMRRVVGASESSSRVLKSSARSFNIGGISAKRFIGSLVGVQSAYSFLSRATRQYISSHSDLNASLQGITIGFGELLAPAIRAVIKALQTVVRWTAIAIAYITTFMNVIFGTNIAIKYMIKDTGDLNKNLGNMGKSAAKGAKRVKNEMNKILAPFDELNVISEDTDDDLAGMGASGVGGGGGGYVAPDMTPFDITDQMDNIKKFNGFLEKHKELIKGITIAVGILIGAWAITKIFNSVKKFVSLISNPWMLAIALIIGAVYLLWKNWDKIAPVVTSMWEKVKPILEGLWSAIKWVGEFVLTSLAFAFNTVLGVIQLVFGTAIAIIKTFVANMIERWNALMEFNRVVWTAIDDIIVEIVKFIKVLIKEAITYIIDTLKMFKDVFVTIVEFVWNQWKITWNLAKDLIKVFVDIIVGAFEGFYNTFKAILDTVWKVWSAIWTTIRDFAKGIFGVLTGDGTTLGQVFTQLWKNIKNVFVVAWEGIKNVGKTVFDSLLGIGKSMGEGLKAVWNGIKNSFANAFNAIKNIFGSVWNWIIGRFAQGGKIFNAFKDGVLSVFKTIVNALIRGINVVIGTPFRLLNNSLNKFKNISILGKKPFNFIPNIPVPNIPQLATGNVASDETLAIFGEYTGAKHNPEITTPQRTMENSMRKIQNEQKPQEVGGDLHLEVNVNNKTEISETIKDYNQYKRRGGKLSFGNN